MWNDFELNEEVGILEQSLYSEVKIHKGMVIYKGRKILKVKKDDLILEFKEKKTVSNGILGYYKVFPSVLDAEQYLEDVRTKNELVESIKKDLDKLPIEKLNKIKEIMN